MHNKFTQKAQNTLKTALSEAGKAGHSYVGSEHILLALMCEKDSIAARILASHGLTQAKIKACIVDICGTGEPCRPTSADLTENARAIIESSAAVAEERGCTYIGTEHLLCALLCRSESTANRIITTLGVSPTSLLADLCSHASVVYTPTVAQEQKEAPTKTHTRATPALTKYSRDLTRLALDGGIDPVVGREKETERIIGILCRRKKNNPCLVGEPGVGKTAIVEGLAKRIADKDVPDALCGTRILCLDLPSMLAGAKYRGEFEERMKNVMSEAERCPEIILFIDELHTVVGAGAAEGAVDAANILKPALARSGLRLIGATTVSEYKKHIERDPALERRFQSVNVDEPSADDTLRLLAALKEGYEKHHGIKINDRALRAATQMSVRFINDRFLPDKAIDLIDEAAARARMHTDKAKREVDEDDIAEVVELWTGIPRAKILCGRDASLSGLEERLCERIIGQSEAISAVCSAIRRGGVGLSESGRPTGVFMFSGKTGVGKTELALAVAEELFGSKKALVRFDMSEYTEKHSVSKLIGSPPGYVGYSEGGLLTEKVRRRPFCVLLFDEIEKAHPDIFNVLLPVLEDGKLCDAQGREVSFCNTVIIMTSNSGVLGCSHTAGFTTEKNDREQRKNAMLSALRTQFRPEFLSRIDEIVIFDDLTLPALEAIAHQGLDKLSSRAKGIGLDITFTPAVASHIATEAQKQANGARNVRNLIAKQIEAPLALAVLNNSAPATVDVSNGKIVI